MKLPKPGQIAGCRFPYAEIGGPGPKVRPVLIVEVEGAIPVYVHVAYGTTKRVWQCQAGQFSVGARDAADFVMSGLRRDTKFDLLRRQRLPFSAEWFAAPEWAAGVIIGQLSPAMLVRLSAAWAASKG